MPKFFSLFCLITVCSVPVFGQFQVDNSGNWGDPDWLVQNILTGEGIKVSNVEFYGYDNQIAYFSEGAATGLESGVMLSNGDVTAVVPGTTNRMNNGLGESVQGGGGDDDLLTIANEVPALVNKNFTVARTKDAAILEFDFVSITDSVEVSFVFASEEYEDLSNAQSFLFTKFNDVFGFFVSGPGISGPYSAPAEFPNGSANLATIPENDWPITVSTVNGEFNAPYFIDNKSNSDVFPFNGLTVNIRKKFRVEPCAKYHFRFAIADGQDDSYDSAVLLQEGSFKSTTQIATFEEDPSGENKLFESCSSLNFQLELPATNTSDQIIRVNIPPSMDATKADFLNWPDSIIMEAGVQQKSFSLPIVLDGVADDNESFQMELVFESGCTEPIYSPVYSLHEYEPLVLSFQQNPDSLACPNDPVEIRGNVSGGMGTYWAHWELDGAIVGDGNEINFNPTPLGEVLFVVEDSCFQPVSKVWEPKARSGVPPKLNPLPDQALCVGDSLFLEATTTGGFGTSEVFWVPLELSGREHRIIGKDVVNTMTSNEAYAVVIDECGLTDTAFFELAINNPGARFEYSIDNDFYLNVHNVSEGTYDELNWYLNGDLLYSNIERFTHKIESVQDFHLRMEIDDSTGCGDFHEELILFPIRVFVPNAFSPNGDGYNDLFEVKGTQDLSSYLLRIYDRWGSLIFESKDPQEAWDGTLPNGDMASTGAIYLWTLELAVGNRYSSDLNGVIHVL